MVLDTTADRTSRDRIHECNILLVESRCLTAIQCNGEDAIGVIRGVQQDMGRGGVLEWDIEPALWRLVREKQVEAGTEAAAETASSAKGPPAK